MDTTSELVERHVRASELQLRRIDELIAQARSAAPAAPAVEPLLAEIEANRARLARELESLRREAPHDAAVGHGAGLQSALEAAGLQFERMLGSVLQAPRR